jgi:glutamyl/glutaminyl-tRNA synthetase
MKVESLSDVKQSLVVALGILENISEEEINLEDIKAAFLNGISKNEMKNGQVLWPVRVALSMQQFSPGAIELIYIFGKEKSMQRIQKILKQI